MTDTIVTIFELSGAEQRTLQLALDEAGRRIGKLERENTVVSRGEDGSVMMVTQPFAIAGGAVYDDLMRAFAWTLGPDRHAVFAAVAAEQVEHALADLGAADRTLTIRRGQSGAGYLLSFSHERLGGSGWSGNVPAATREELAALMLGLAPLLPADF